MKPKRPKRYKADRLDASAITPELALEWRAPRFGSGESPTDEQSTMGMAG